MTQEALKISLGALEYVCRHYCSNIPEPVDSAITAIKEALAQEQECWCTTCRPITMADMRFVVCPDCGNKRCPKANDHRNACTNSNEVGQKGSSWEHVKPLAQPEQEPVCPDCKAKVLYECVACSSNNYPPQRTWVGLTDEEIYEAVRPLFNSDEVAKCGLEVSIDEYRAIEAKLKEKNT